MFEDRTPSASKSDSTLVSIDPTNEKTNKPLPHGPSQLGKHVSNSLSGFDQPLPLRTRSTRSTRSTRRTFWQRASYIIRKRMAFKPPVKHDPRLYPPGKKRWILACLALGSSLNGFCSTVYLPGLPNIQEDLEASEISVALTTSLFILFGGIGPIIWASMSDFYHIRRFLYLTSLLLFVGATLGCGLSPNVWVLVVLRCIQSVGTSVTMSVGAGTVADCWEITERGSAFSVLFVGQFLGPLVGPIIGGGIVSTMGWRATFWFCAGYGVFLFCFLLLFLPETYRIDHVWDNGLPIKKQPPLPPLDVATRDEEDGGSSDVASNEVESDDSDDEYIQEPPPQGRMNPIQSIALLRHTFVWLIALQTGFCFGTMFTIETIIPDLYDEYYHFESWQTGLSFLGAGIGNVLGAIVSGRLSDLFLRRARDKRGGLSVKEDRLTLNAWPGGFLCVPLGVLIFGWCTSPSISVWAPIIGFSIVCFGMSQVYASGSAYLVDAIPGKGASVTACSNLVRLLMACILSLIAKPIVSSIGAGYLSVILAALNYIGMGFYALVKFKGASFRKSAGYGDQAQ